MSNASNTFKVTVPKGSVLEEELEGFTGRARTTRLYVLAELGCEVLRKISPYEKGSLQTPAIQSNQGKKTEKVAPRDGGTKFDLADLTNL